jgi:hypothetical protein
MRPQVNPSFTVPFASRNGAWSEARRRGSHRQLQLDEADRDDLLFVSPVGEEVWRSRKQVRAKPEATGSVMKPSQTPLAGPQGPSAPCFWDQFTREREESLDSAVLRTT